MQRTLFVLMIIVFFCCSFSSASKYDTMLQKINQLVDKYPQYIQLIDIGKNDQQNTIYGMKIENRSYQTKGDAKINQLLVGVHHGNEGLSADVCLTFTEKLIKSIRELKTSRDKALAHSIFYVIPVLNISGYNRNYRRETDKNGRDLDPNRDYPDPCAHNTYFQLASIRDLAQFVDRYNIVGCVTVHGYIGTFTFPWGIYTKDTTTKDDAFFKQVARKSVKANGYRIGTHADAIYPASGAFEDWAYNQYGVWTMLLELRRGANLNKDSECLLTFFSLVPDQRSKQHKHNPANCESGRIDGPGRP